MLNEQQNRKLLAKLKRTLSVFEQYVFRPIGQLNYKVFETKEDFREVPDDSYFTDKSGTWGGEGVYCWFKGSFTPSNELENQPLYIIPNVGGYEAMLWIDGKPYGTFASKITVTRHGNHYSRRICKNADPKKPIDIAVEYYAGHYVKGCQPFEDIVNTGFKYKLGEINICVKNQIVSDFIYDMRILTQLVEMSDLNSFRRAEIMNTLTEVHKVLYYSPENVDNDTWTQSLKAAIDIMKKSLSLKNGDSAPEAVIVGHSHMDTAWLWTIRETIKKNARTISNQLNLMEEFPEYRFIQSSSYHSKMIEMNYPELFERMKEQIANGRYEPNGSVWIESDCNIPSGESLIRQFLWGQRYTKEKFGYLSDCFWLPDTFGYSAAIPQIMKGFGVKYFLTTKLSWNDTNEFPFDTFTWQGLDSSSVIVHFFDMDTWPDPKGLLERINGIGHKNSIKCKQVSNSRLIAFGFGDGGGGPQFEMIELAQRLENLEGCPKVRYSSVSAYMDEIAQKSDKLPKYVGELYLELHRGTLTGKQQIKKNNRMAEKSLRNIEIIEVMDAVSNNRAASDSDYRDLWETLLVNQFHDILPGSCIPQAHDQSIEETTELILKSEQLILQKLANQKAEIKEKGPQIFSFTAFNSLSKSRKDVMYIPTDKYLKSHEAGIKTQLVTQLDGSTVLAVSNFEQEAFSYKTIKLGEAQYNKEESAFIYEDNKLITPFVVASFDENGYICSLVDKYNLRELCHGTLPLNAFISAEDVPAGWDGWDIDADCMLKLKSDAVLLSREVAANGNVEFRIRSEYRVGKESKISQDMIFYADSPLIAFDTMLEWRDKHHVLKVSFDTTVKAQYASHEIQFGNIKRPVTRNNTIEQAMFEVCNHKYTDISEPGYGVSLFNNCKYGISVENGCMSLSLAKGGMRPDDRGDVGNYSFKYAFLPHIGGFNAQNVIQPAYAFNYERLVSEGSFDMNSFISTDAENVLVETIKPCEDNQNAFIVRLYECEGTHTAAELNLGIQYNSLELCDMMEEPIYICDCKMVFKPFEIKTVKVRY